MARTSASTGMGALLLAAGIPIYCLSRGKSDEQPKPLWRSRCMMRALLKIMILLGSITAARSEGDLAPERRQMVEEIEVMAASIASDRDRSLIRACSQRWGRFHVTSSCPRTSAAAYRNRPLSIGQGQTISQPFIVALMTDLLQLKGTDKVLEVGTGSGYQAAILSVLAREVYSIEIIPQLGEAARTSSGDWVQQCKDQDRRWLPRVGRARAVRCDHCHRGSRPCSAGAGRAAQTQWTNGNPSR